MEKEFIGGFYFPARVLKRNLDVFKEGLAHSSLSCELFFNQLYLYEEELERLKENNSKKLFQSLNKKKQEEIRNLVRFYVLYSARYLGAITENFTKEDTAIINRIYEEKYSDFDKWIYTILVFNENGFDERATYRKVIELFRILPNYKVAYDKAHHLKEDHLKAFDYSLTLEHIGISEIIKINAMVVESQEEKEIGFKKVNNQIPGTHFKTVEKELVPNEMSKLLYEYHYNFGREKILKKHSFLTHEEQKQIMMNILRKEAEFHIRFERIHPFSDGNGRTGRILLSRNLYKQGLAPVLITEASMDKYKRFIDEYDIDGFTSFLYENTTQTLTVWIAELQREKNNILVEAEELNRGNLKP